MCGARPDRRPGRIEEVLAQSLRRRARLSAAIAVAAAALAILSTAAVRYDLATGEIGGGLGLLVTTLEVVFIAGIIPLLVSALYFGANAAALHHRLRRGRLEVPRARVRRAP